MRWYLVDQSRFFLWFIHLWSLFIAFFPTWPLSFINQLTCHHYFTARKFGCISSIFQCNCWVRRFFHFYAISFLFHSIVTVIHETKTLLLNWSFACYFCGCILLSSFNHVYVENPWFTHSSFWSLLDWLLFLRVTDIALIHCLVCLLIFLPVCFWKHREF